MSANQARLWMPMITMMSILCDPNHGGVRKSPLWYKEYKLLWMLGRQDMKCCRVTNIWVQINGNAAQTTVQGRRRKMLRVGGEILILKLNKIFKYGKVTQPCL